MDVSFDFSDVNDFFNEGEKEVQRDMASVGEEAVRFAKENGNYKDHTGNLRKSNISSVEDDGLVLENEAEYASYVESKGFEVLGSAALYAEKRLKEEFE